MLPSSPTAGAGRAAPNPLSPPNPRETQQYRQYDTTPRKHLERRARRRSHIRVRVELRRPPRAEQLLQMRRGCAPDGRHELAGERGRLLHTHTHTGVFGGVGHDFCRATRSDFGRDGAVKCENRVISHFSPVRVAASRARRHHCICFQPRAACTATEPPACAEPARERYTVLLLVLVLLVLLLVVVLLVVLSVLLVL
jgi:hypothetical protein